MSRLSLSARTPEEAARRRFGLWAGGLLILFLPLWWMWGADAAAWVLRPIVGMTLSLFGLTGRVEAPAQGGWLIGTRLTQGGEAVVLPLSNETLRRLLLGIPLTAAFLIAPPRPTRPWRAAGVSVAVIAVVFALSVVAAVWGELAPMLDPGLASPSLGVIARLDQPPLHPFAAQVGIVGRYVALSIVPLLTALILWATLNPLGLKTLVAEIED